MILPFAQPHVTTAVHEEPDTSRFVPCPMCHTPSSLTQTAIDAGGDWQCQRCGQLWNASRLSTVVAYEVWDAGRVMSAVKSPHR
jgi:hypothetical protein